MSLLTRVNARLARYGMYFAVTGLLFIVAIVAFQVFGRYVMNDSPTWAENLALLLILYVTLIGAAVGVRDAGHIGLESLLILVPEKVRNKLELVIHVLVAIFGGLMLYNGWVLGMSVAPYKLSNLNISEGARYVPLVLSGALIILFSIEHIIALLKGTEVEPAWH
jgi:TRAP-type C4-dicarboxylate transport system permease small subunit